MAEDFVDGAFGAPQGGVEGDDAGVVVVDAVDGARAEPEDEPQDARGGVDGAVPAEGVPGEADAGEGGIEAAAVDGAVDAHDPHEERKHYRSGRK